MILQPKRTAYIGAYGYGNLGDELCLIEAMRSFPPTQAFAFSVDPAWTTHCVPKLDGTFNTMEQMLDLGVERVVFGGGGIGTLPGLDLYTRWMMKAVEAGAEAHIHNIGVAKLDDLKWIDEERRKFFVKIPTFSVRDFRSLEMVNTWNIHRIPHISFYPERTVEPDFSVAEKLLPKGEKLLGISIINTQKMRQCLQDERDRIRTLLSHFSGWSVVPIVSTIHQTAEEENDGLGFQHFADLFLKDFKIVAREMYDRAWWSKLTPRTLKGIIASLDTLISQRKHNCIHAIGSGVKVLGFHPRRDDSIPRTFLTLTNYLAPGSRYISLYQPDLPSPPRN
jgi:hypothetical protein